MADFSSPSTTKTDWANQEHALRNWRGRLLRPRSRCLLWVWRDWTREHWWAGAWVGLGYIARTCRSQKQRTKHLCRKKKKTGNTEGHSTLAKRMCIQRCQWGVQVYHLLLHLKLVWWMRIVIKENSIGISMCIQRCQWGVQVLSRDTVLLLPSTVFAWSGWYLGVSLCSGPNFRAHISFGLIGSTVKEV